MTQFRLAAVAAATALAMALPAQAVSVSASTAPAATTVGASTTLTLTLTLSDPIDLLGLTLNLDWPSTGLAFSPAASTALGGSWPSFVALFDPLSSVSVAAGSFGASALLLVPFSLPAGDSTLGLSFVGLAPGSHTVHYFVDLVEPSFSPLSVEGDGSVQVSAVPEPSPALMLAAGVAVLGLLARRRRA